jgi:hypothetical protein
VLADTALFHADGDTFVPSVLTRGPWDPRAQHGGATSALCAHVLERHDPGPASFVARLTVELMRPVPLTPLTVAARTVRPGRKVQWLEASVRAGDAEVARAVALRMRAAVVDVAHAVGPPCARPPGPETVAPLDFGFGERVGLWDAHDVRLVAGRWDEAGPAAAWFRLRCAVVDGEAPTPLERVAACADFGSGIGSPTRFTAATGINAEITLHLHRHPEGEWVCLESGGFAEPHGVGLAETRLHDERGGLGRAAQSLLVEPVSLRPPPG